MKQKTAIRGNPRVAATKHKLNYLLWKCVLYVAVPLNSQFRKVIKANIPNNESLIKKIFLIFILQSQGFVC